MPDLEKGAAMWEALLAEGLYVNLARPPATPAGMTLLRCSLCAEHSDAEVGEVLLSDVGSRADQATGVIVAEAGTVAPFFRLLADARLLPPSELEDRPSP